MKKKGDSTVLGTYEGMSLDSNITNNNGLDITNEVIQTVLESEEYQRALPLRHYIGFLGHPEDINSMDFEHACIVLTSMELQDDNKVYCSFDLIDTPVGRIVKAFQTAGVQFGVSIRGAGDIISNSVDPETFVFRGFDLVTFPAYSEAIPTFTEIAASTDAQTQKKYQNVCAAVKTNVEQLNSVQAVEVIQSQFAAQSEEYKLLEEKKRKLCASEVVDISSTKINAMTTLYIDTLSRCNTAIKANKKLEAELTQVKNTRKRTVLAATRILEDQLNNAVADAKDLEHKYNEVVKANTELKNNLKSIKASNLIYQQKIEKQTTESKSEIARLNSQLRETITASKKVKSQTLNYNADIEELQKEVKASKKLIADYQDAFAHLYAGAVGFNLQEHQISVTASTTVDELKDSINSGTNTANIASKFETPDFEIVDSEDDVATL